MSGERPPAGYEEFFVGNARVVALSALGMAIREAMSDCTMFEWAATSAGARALVGRGTAWAATLPGGGAVVVRHSRHGGSLAALTSDLFLAPTRAPRELRTALRLMRADVPTSEVVAYAIYPVLGPLARADVATRLIDGADFPEAWQASRTAEERLRLMQALAKLLIRMQDAGAMHPDLNLKNVFISRNDQETTAYVLDVDRVEFLPPSGGPGARNLGRLLRSAQKLNRRYGLGMDFRTYLEPLLHAVSHKTPR